MSEFPLADGGAVRCVPPVPTHVYGAVWTLKGKDAFWPLLGCFTEALIAGKAILVSFKFDGQPEQASIDFAVRFRSAPDLAMFLKERLDEVEQTVKPLDSGVPFDLGPDLLPRRFQHTIYLVGGDNPALRAVNCWMRALMQSKCRLLQIDAGGDSAGAYFAFTIEGTRRQLEIAQGIIANADLENA